MKQIKFSLLILASIMFTLVGCKKESNDGSNDVEIDNYFTLDEGQIVEDYLPEPSQSADRPEINTVEGNTYIVNGGVSLIQIESDDQFSKVIVGLKNQEFGYYEIENSLKATNDIFTFSLLINEDLEESLVFVFAIVNEDGLVSDYKEIEASLVESQGGALQINCSWDLSNDIDLHVVAPDGNEIYYGNPGGVEYDYVGIYNHYLGLNLTDESEIYDLELTDEQWAIIWNLTEEEMADFSIPLAGGILDIDSNPGCYIDGVNSENIIFQADDLQTGEYIVRVDFYDDCQGSGETNYVVSAKLNGVLLDASPDNPNTGSFNSGEQDYGDIGDGVEVMRFNISQNQLKSGITEKGYVFKNPQVAEPEFSVKRILNQKRKTRK